MQICFTGRFIQQFDLRYYLGSHQIEIVFGNSTFIWYNDTVRIVRISFLVLRPVASIIRVELLEFQHG